MTAPDTTPSAPEHNYEYGREHDGYSHMGIPPACPACAAEPAPTPSSALAGIRERQAVAASAPDATSAHGGHFRALAQLACQDVPSLVDAFEAVLALHQPVTTNGGWLEGREWQECGDCGPNNAQESVYAMPGSGEEFWPCPTYRAITTALTGTAQLSEDENHG